MSLSEWFSLYVGWYIFWPVAVATAGIAALAAHRNSKALVAYGSAGLLVGLSILGIVYRAFERHSVSYTIGQAALAAIVAGAPVVAGTCIVSALAVQRKIAPAWAALATLVVGVLLIPLGTLSSLYATCLVIGDCP
jgi:hypothetical protein